jgi:putative ABC transport system permease protein
MKATLDARSSDVSSDVPAELPVLVYTLDGVLLTIAVTTLVAVTILAVREHVRDFGVLRTVGLTPRQVTSSLVSAHTAVAVVAATASIPFGIGLYVGLYGLAGGDSSDLVIAPWWWLALVPSVAVAAAVVAVATGLPARLAARTPIIDALRYE